MSLDINLQCNCCGGYVFHVSITHNLGKMAEHAGLYKPMWHPDELGIERAHDLSALLREGLEKLLKNPMDYNQFEPKNEWGSYEGLVSTVTEYYTATVRYPNAIVSTFK